MAASYSFFVYASPGAAEWGWRLANEDGRILAVSGEGYASRAACDEAIHLLSRQAAEATICYSVPDVAAGHPLAQPWDGLATAGAD